MTDEELIEELSEMGRHPCRAQLPMGERLRQAADRLKALTAENERLREGLNAIIDRGVERDQKWMGMNGRDIARTTLEKQP
jgi:hypothetical protein